MKRIYLYSGCASIFFGQIQLEELSKEEDRGNQEIKYKLWGSINALHSVRLRVEIVDSFGKGGIQCINPEYITNRRKTALDRSMII